MCSKPAVPGSWPGCVCRLVVLGSDHPQLGALIRATHCIAVSTEQEPKGDINDLTSILPQKPVVRSDAIPRAPFISLQRPVAGPAFFHAGESPAAFTQVEHSRHRGAVAAPGAQSLGCARASPAGLWGPFTMFFLVLLFIFLHSSTQPGTPGLVSCSGSPSVQCPIDFFLLCISTPRQLVVPVQGDAPARAAFGGALARLCVFVALACPSARGLSLSL